MTVATIQKKVSLLAALLLLAPVFSAPANAQMPADVVKAGCNVLPSEYQHLFSVKNANFVRVCQVRWIPLAGTGCPIVTAIAPAGWTTTVFPDGTALFVASTSAACVSQGTTKPGFGIGVSTPGTCCYLIEFMNAAGTILHTTTRCCTCGPVSVENESWGRVKALYQ
jgi:hypothetical protein